MSSISFAILQEEEIKLKPVISFDVGRIIFTSPLSNFYTCSPL